MGKKSYSLFYILGILFIFGIALHLPFLSQAFHIDDDLNIRLGRHILKDFLNPYNFSVVYNGVEQKFYEFYANPPLNGYFISFIIHFFGENEIPLHLSFLIFTFLSGLFMFLIGRLILKNTEDAVFSSILFLVSPGVFVMSNTIMSDLPLLCFYLAAIYLFLKADIHKNNFLYILSGLCAGIGCLLRFSGLSIIVIFLFYILLKIRKNVIFSSTAILIPIFFFLAWRKYTLHLYAANYLNNLFTLELSRLDFLRAAKHLLANITYSGGSVLFPLSFLYFINKLNRINVIMIGIFFFTLFCTALILFKVYGHSASQSLTFFVLAFSFCVFILTCFKHLRSWLSRKHINIFLFFWLLFLLFFNSLFLQTAVKYNLILFPPVILLFIDILRNNSLLNNHRYLRVIKTIILATLILSFLIAASDREYANLYRDITKKLYLRYKTKDNQLYFSGHWGWCYYMEEAGAKPIKSLELGKITKNDIIIFPSIPWPQPMPIQLMEKIQLQDKVVIYGRLPLKTMNGWAKAFFYSDFNYPNYYGVLPYSFSARAPLECFYILRVQ